MEICELAVVYGVVICVTDIYVIQLHEIYVEVLNFTLLFMAFQMYS
jgi:hypothetical protein